MCMTHCIMVIDQCTKYGQLKSNPKSAVTWLKYCRYGVKLYQSNQSIKPKNVMGRTQKHVKNTINLTLRSTFIFVSRSSICATHRLMVIHPCTKNRKEMSNKINLLARHESAQTDGHRQTDSDSCSVHFITKN